MKITIENGKSAEYEFFMYKNPVEVHKELFNKNGRSLIPPKWMFGPWLQVHTHTSESIPVRSDVLLKTDDIPYSTGVKVGERGHF